MQSYSKTAGALNCSDCKSRFHSAASLLQHFAQHISRENKHEKFGHSLNKMSSQEQLGELSSHVQKKKKIKNTGILEKVLRDSVPLGPSHHESSSIDVCIVRELCSSSLSSSSDSLQESKTNISPSSNITCDLKPPNRNNDYMEVFMKDQNSSKVSFLGDNSLVKCDLQKRLENCIRKLASKQSSNLEIHSSTEKQQYANSTIVQEDVDNFNPLKLGTATKGESDTCLETSSSHSVNFKISNRKSTGASSRKQQSPKKIFYSITQNLSKSNEEDISEFTEINNFASVDASSSPLSIIYSEEGISVAPTQDENLLSSKSFCGDKKSLFSKKTLYSEAESSLFSDEIDVPLTVINLGASDSGFYLPKTLAIDVTFPNKVNHSDDDNLLSGSELPLPVVDLYPGTKHSSEMVFLKDCERNKLTSCSSANIISDKSPKKKYQCHMCSKSFGWSTDLKRHILTHTGERPFKCGQCQATFTRNFLLQKHETKFHPDGINLVPSSCEIQEVVSEVKNENSENSFLDLSQFSKDDKKINKMPTNKRLEESIATIGTTSVVKQKSKRFSTVKQNKLKDSWRLHSAQNVQDLPYNPISFEIFTQEALNIL